MDGVIRFLLENNHPIEGPVLGRRLLDNDSDVTRGVLYKRVLRFYDRTICFLRSRRSGAGALRDQFLSAPE